MGLAEVREELDLAAQRRQGLGRALAGEDEAVGEVDAARGGVPGGEVLEPAAGLVGAPGEGRARGAAGGRHDLPVGFRELRRELGPPERHEAARRDELGLVGLDPDEDRQVLRRGREVPPPQEEEGEGVEAPPADLRGGRGPEGDAAGETGEGGIEKAQVVLAQAEQGPAGAGPGLEPNDAAQGVARRLVAARLGEGLAEAPPAVVPEGVQVDPGAVVPDGLLRAARLPGLVRLARELLERYARHAGRVGQRGQGALRLGRPGRGQARREGDGEESSSHSRHST